MNLENITPEHLDAISSTWALKLNRANLYYQNLLKKVSSGDKDWKELPYFVVEALRELGY